MPLDSVREYVAGVYRAVADGYGAYSYFTGPKSALASAAPRSRLWLISLQIAHVAPFQRRRKKEGEKRTEETGNDERMGRSGS